MENINENRIRQHIEGLFSDAPKTTEVHNIREDMIMNTIERYHDLVNGGMASEQAYIAAINSIGDVSELIASFGGEQATVSSVSAAPTQAKKGGVGRTIAIIAAIICGTILIVTLIGCITGISIFNSIIKSEVISDNISSGMSYTFGGDDAGFDNPFAADCAYTINADGITDISVDWISGSVAVQPYDGKYILLEESAEAAISQDNALRYKLDGNKLTVRFCKSRTWSGIDSTLANINSIIAPKALIVSVPRAMLNSDELKVRLSSVSNTNYIENASLKELEIETTSGGVLLKNVSVAEEMDLDTVSGEIDVEGCRANELDACSVSGDMYINGSFEAAEFDCTSSSVFFSTEGSIKALKADTVSGDVTLNLPDESGFTMEVSTVSGDVYDFSTTNGLTRDGNTYTFGDGSMQFDIGTVSGDITVSTFTLEQ